MLVTRAGGSQYVCVCAHVVKTTANPVIVMLTDILLVECFIAYHITVTSHSVRNS